jgi:hypothetical protein
MRDNNQYKIFTELADQKSNYESSRLEKVDGLYRSQYEVIKMCEYYSDSRYLGHYKGNKDKLDRPVPFYNIVNYRVALAKTATDLDIKDIQIVSDHPNYEVASMLLNHEAYEWMKESEFAETLNDMGLTRPKYGGYLVKKTEDKEGLKIKVVRWTNVITDQNDILGGAIIEIHHMSPVEIKRKDGTWDNVNDLLKLHKKMKAKDRPTSIDVYEITGEFPKSVLNDALNKEDTDEDEFLFSLQHYFIADIDGQKFMLYAEELKGEMEDYYGYLAWEDNGYGLGRGVIEDSEEAQVWTNDAVINESIAMALAGRVGIKTNSKKLGQSVLEHDHGKIYELEDGKDINSFSLVPAALGQYQNQIEKWRAQADNVTSSYNAVTGENPPSGTPYSQTALLNQVATKPFDYKREVWGIHLTQLFENWVILYLVKKLYKEHILVSEFTDTELQTIDDSFAAAEGNSWVKEQLLKGQTVDPADQQAVMNTYKDHIKKTGKKRYIEIPEGYFDDIECKVTVVTTGEQKNKAVILQSLSQIMRDVIASFNPTTGEFGVLTDPTLSKIFNSIVEMSGAGISPVSIGKGTRPTKQVAQAPTPSPMETPSMPAAPVSAPLAQ